MHDGLRQLVAARLEENWSPEQIAGWLKHTYPGNEAYQVSHETIYRSLFVQARGVLKKDLQAHLRTGRAIRRSRHASNKKDQRGSLTDMISIRERPASVEDRACLVTVAARLKREHQRPAAAVLPQGHQPRRSLTGALGRDRAAA